MNNPTAEMQPVVGSEVKTPIQVAYERRNPDLDPQLVWRGKAIARWFIGSGYNEESFFVRHASFLGQDDPYKSLKTTLRAQIDEEAWDSLNRDISRPFQKPTTGRIAVKVINHLGDEVMKVFSA